MKFQHKTEMCAAMELSVVVQPHTEMKPRATAVVALLSILLWLLAALSGCGANEAQSATGGGQSAQSGASVSSGIEPQQPAEQGAPAVVGTLHKLPNGIFDGHTMKSGVNAGDAFYELPRESSFGQNIILKTDYATGKQTCICQKPGCTHTDESCNAFVETLPRKTMTVYDGKIYISFGGFPASLRTEAEKSAIAVPDEEKYITSYVDVISPDAMEKQRLVEFPEGMYVLLQYCDDKALYGNYEIIEPQGGGRYSSLEWGILRLDVETGAYTTAKNPRTNERNIGIYDNKLVYHSIAAEQNLDALAADYNTEAYNGAMETAVLQFDAFDPATGVREPLATLPSAKDIMVDFMYDGKVYYHNRRIDETGMLVETDIEYFVLDFATGAQTTLEILQDNLQLRGQLESLNALQNSEKSLPLMLCLGRETNDAAAYLNVETKEMKKVALKTREGEPCLLLALTNDGRWLITMGRILEGEIERLRYALVAPDDLFVDGAPYTEVEAYENSPTV